MPCRAATDGAAVGFPRAAAGAGLDLRAHLAAIERKLIEQALQRVDGIVAQAARLLDLRRTTLVEKLRKLGTYHHRCGRPDGRLTRATAIRCRQCDAVHVFARRFTQARLLHDPFCAPTGAWEGRDDR